MVMYNNGAAPMQNSSAIPQKVKYGVTLGPRNSTPRYISK